MSLLTIIQDAADLLGIRRPSAVLSSTDQQVRQLLAYANAEGRQLSRRHPWQACMAEATHTTLAAEDQGALTTILPGLRYLITDAIWNRTQLEPVGGPLSAHEWQALKAFTVTGPYQDYRIREGRLLLIPAPPAGETLAFEYLSNYWCESSTGTAQTRWAADDDVGRLSEELMTAGIRWRFLAAKGLSYDEEFLEYEELVTTDMANDGGRRILRLDRGMRTPRPEIRAPIGSWNL